MCGFVITEPSCARAPSIRCHTISRLLVFMKIALLSDFHLGYGRFREDAYKQAEEALGKAADLADLLLIPGDIFDNRNPDPEILAEAITLFRNLSERDWKARVTEFEGAGRHFTSVPVVAIPGTHERRAEGVEDPVDLLGLAGLLVDVSNAQAIVEKDGERVAIRGIGGIADDRFREVLKKDAPRPAPGMFSIFLFHESVYEFLPFSKDFIKTEELPDGFDLYACGHIHSRVESKAHGKPFLIPGSTVLTQLKGGEQERKGFYIFDTKTGAYSFNCIDSRRFVLVRISAGGRAPSEIERDIEERIKAEAARGDVPILRIEIEGRLKEGYRNLDINTPELVERYRKMATVEIGKLGMELEEGADAGKVTKSLPVESISIKDYGLGIFMEKLKESKYGLQKNPAELFEMLSADEKKDSVVGRVVDMLIG